MKLTDTRHTKRVNEIHLSIFYVIHDDELSIGYFDFCAPPGKAEGSFYYELRLNKLALWIYFDAT